MKLNLAGIEIVRGCQLQCIGCPNSTLNPKVKFMPIELYRSCLNNIDVQEVDRLRLHNFGETLMHPELPAMLNILYKQSFKIHCVEISTNAQVHNFEMLSEIFKTGIIDKFAVSCDGNGFAEDYERTRYPAKWDKLILFLGIARKYRDDFSPQTKLVTRTICETVEGQRRWRKILEPFDFIPNFIRYISLPNSLRSRDISHSKEEPPKGNINALNSVCHWVQQKNLFVEYDGNVNPCCCHPRVAVLGNLLNSRFSEIFKGYERKTFIASLMRDRKNMPLCSMCEWRSLGHNLPVNIDFSKKR
ncbi:MAG: hypothetical protein HW406_2641 [Candidatus Brocadiaceae bacterium]|nr:hypothetical protein [Candidatus Brocadiaceae bacterium]MBM2835480.1 hypothetical protein [Candidatus Brocadiaceae bacterium]